MQLHYKVRKPGFKIMKTILLLILCCLALDYGKGCLDRWVRLGSVCYLFEDQKQFIWEDARKHCQMQGGRLAEPVNSDETQHIEEYSRENGCHAFWLGIKKGSDGKFHYHSSSRTLTYQHFYAGEPSNSGGIEDCVEFSCQGWNDDKCTAAVGVLCQDDDATSLTPATTTTTVATTTAAAVKPSPTTSASEVFTSPNHLNNQQAEQSSTSSSNLTFHSISHAESKGSRTFPWTACIILTQAFICSL